MKCSICRTGTTSPGYTTVTLTPRNLTLVVKRVPAEVCDTCGEVYVDQATTARLLETAADAERAGVEVDVREFVAA